MVESEAKFETNIENYSKVAGKGIRVNSVNPGVIVTGIFETAGMTPMQVTEYYEARMNTSQPYLIMVVIIRSFFYQECKKLHPLGRPGTAEEVATTIVFLASKVIMMLMMITSRSHEKITHCV